MTQNSAQSTAGHTRVECATARALTGGRGLADSAAYAVRWAGARRAYYTYMGARDVSDGSAQTLSLTQTRRFEFI